MTTTDNLQGEESDAVILSLVRSNEEGKPGFVKVPNRICVALSRARHGMFVIGILWMLAAHSPLWGNIFSDLESRNQIGPALVVQCLKYPSTAVEVRTNEDFNSCPNEGCTLPCN